MSKESLGRLDSCTLREIQTLGVRDHIKAHGLGIQDKKLRRSPKSEINLSAQIIALGGYCNSHLSSLLSCDSATAQSVRTTAILR
ncbi:MAG: hypothetical protein NTY44_00560 [Deltaproteobacteria bacterium]|nr:hypothetical protein [Deltaproteobacteria bacterium]